MTTKPKDNDAFKFGALWAFMMHGIGAAVSMTILTAKGLMSVFLPKGKKKKK